MFIIFMLIFSFHAFCLYSSGKNSQSLTYLLRNLEKGKESGLKCQTFLFYCECNPYTPKKLPLQQLSSCLSNLDCWGFWNVKKYNLLPGAHKHKHIQHERVNYTIMIWCNVFLCVMCVRSFPIMHIACIRAACRLKNIVYYMNGVE